MQAKSKAAKAPVAKSKRKPAKPAAAAAEVVAGATKSKQKVVGSVAPEAVTPHVKLVRDSFTMPREDFDLIAQLKARALDFKRPAKKSELLRAGLQVLAALPDAQLHAALEALRPLKAGRPKRKH